MSKNSYNTSTHTTEQNNHHSKNPTGSPVGAVRNKLEQIKKKIFMSMKIMDTSIKGVKESQDYLLAQAYNQGLRDAMSIFETELKQ